MMNWWSDAAAGEFVAGSQADDFSAAKTWWLQMVQTSDHRISWVADALADLSCLCDSAAADQWKSGLPGGRVWDMNPMIPTLVRYTTWKMVNDHEDYITTTSSGKTREMCDIKWNPIIN